MDRVELTLSLVADMRLQAHTGETPDAWLTLGLGQDLDGAYEVALNGMLDLMCKRLDCTRKQAMALASIAAHLRVTQVVNGVVGVYALLPRNAIR